MLRLNSFQIRSGDRQRVQQSLSVHDGLEGVPVFLSSGFNDVHDGSLFRVFCWRTRASADATYGTAWRQQSLMNFTAI